MDTNNTDLTTAFVEQLQAVAAKASFADVKDAAKERILDALSVIYDGLGEPASRVAFDSVRPCDGPCTVIGRNATALAADAAFVNAVASHVTGQADCGGGGHPGTFVIPVSLALGERYRCSGREVLRAIAVGYEAAHRMQLAAGPGVGLNGFRSLPMIGVFGAAASASVLSGFDTGRFAAALNFAANMAGGLIQCLADGSVEAHIHAGLAARAGVIAAALAGAGGKTSPSTLDGPSGYFRTFARGQHFDASVLTAETAKLAIFSVKSKWFPVCWVNQEGMLLIRSLQPAGIASSLIERVTVIRPKKGQNGYDVPGVMAAPPYHDQLQAQMSAKFTVCAALLGRPVTETRYFRESFGDPEVEQVARKTSLLVNETGEDKVTVEVVLKDGRTILMRSDDVVDMGWEKDMRARFKRLASAKLRETAHTVCEVVETLETEPDIGRLMQLLRE
jgi:2-methylcitrate dehydratase PrpD